MGVFTLTVRFDSDAPLAITKLAVTLVEPETVNPVTEIPDPETDIPVAPVRFVPMSVTGTVVPCVPDVGLIDERVGPVTVKLTELVFPTGVVTLTDRDETVAFDAMVKVAVTVESLPIWMLLTVTPVPDTTTAVAPVRWLPVNVTGKLEPRTPDVGLMEERVAPMIVKDCDDPVPEL
jgi:hypothetical protein